MVGLSPSPSPSSASPAARAEGYTCPPGPPRRTARYWNPRSSLEPAPSLPAERGTEHAREAPSALRASVRPASVRPHALKTRTFLRLRSRSGARGARARERTRKRR